MLQILVFLLVIGMSVKLVFDLRKDKISLKKFFFWLFIWLCLLGITFFSNIVILSANFIGIERARDLPIYVSIIFLFFLAFKTSGKIEELNAKITKLVKSIALKNEK